MAKAAVRQVSIFINGKEVENTIKSIAAEQVKLNNTLKGMVRGTEEYENQVKELQRVNGIISEHNQRLKGIQQGWSLTKVGLDKFVGVAAGAFAVDSLIGYGKQLYGMGVQMDTLQRKAQIVFGTSLPEITAEAEKNAKAMGLTSAQYVTAAASIQDLLIPMGFQRDQATDLTKQLVNLSGALSEWTGGQIKADEVSHILTKALLGEREQLESLGIKILESDVSAQLAAKGLSKLTGAALEQAKAMATLDLILAKSTDAQTAYATGADSSVRRQAETIAKFQQIVERLSKTLIPIFDGLTTAALGVGNALNYIFDESARTEKAQKSLADQTRDVQAEFNAEIAVITEGNFTQEERARLIKDINAKYVEYLPNLISEKASIDQIKEAQAAANKVFAQKILFLSFQDKITESTKKAAEAAETAFQAEKQRQELLQKDVSNLDSENAEKALENQIALRKTIREISLQTVKDAPKQAESIKKIYGDLAQELGTTLAELEKKFGAATSGSSTTPGGQDGKKKAKEAEETEAQIIEFAKRRADVLAGLNAAQRDAEKAYSEESLQREKEQFDQHVENKKRQGLVDISYEEDRLAAQEKIRLATTDSFELALEATQAHYSQLLILAEQFGLDEIALEKKLAEEKKKILDEVTGNSDDGTFGKLNEELAGKQTFLENALKKGEITEKEFAARSLELNSNYALKKLQLFQSTFEGIASIFSEAFSLFSDSESDFVAFQRSLAIVQIAIDTATAISGIVSAAASTSITPIDLAIKVAAGIGIVLANIAKAKKLLETPVPVHQKKEGGYLVTGAADGRQYNATAIGAPTTGLLPHYPVVFNSNATGAPVLASERGAEYFVSSDALRQPYIANLVRMIDLATHGGRGIAQFADGGVNTTATPAPNTAPASPDMSNLHELTTAIKTLNALLSRGIIAVIPDGTVLDINRRFVKLNEISGGYFR